MQRALALTLAAGFSIGPAAAHPGDHVQMSLPELVAHYAEPDHLAFLALTVIVGWLAYRAGRKAEARIQAKTRAPEKHP